ncbi:light harvesting complex protein [Chrysochromulina tobinii]|uniref:Light harvesting complex protein n=1 Tax=Chrysochromulina tobinii TaxID=1460289 RepID=A0A0M0JRS8_9EUKA|nr:light harvesting complex protein [Chrysochromulina tobinii]|eukprot:KOO29316.1 light harvesting complex protein [Chrysochromulina sp. CCMP291]
MLAFVSAAAGFAPTLTPVAPASMRAAPVRMGYETELGATGPLGLWDPLGLSSKASPAKFARWRAVEIKHGRIAMMATTGYIAQSCFRFGGYLSTSANIKFADVPNGIKGLAAVPPLGLAQILLFIGLMECGTWRFYEGSWPGSVPAGKAPGDVAGEFWVRYTDPAEKKSKLNIELNNGRAAMMGITGMLMHDHLTGSWVPPGF